MAPKPATANPEFTIKMYNSSKQQPPSSIHMPSLKQLNPVSKKGMFHQELPAPTPDVFLDLLQGSAVTIILHSSPSLPPRRYTLPVALVCYHSVYLRTEINCLNDANVRASKKRKVDAMSTGNTEELVVNCKEWELNKEIAKEESIMRLEGVDHTTFGLFLKLMYTGKYPDNADAVVIAGKGTSQSPHTVPNQPQLTVVPQSIHAWLLAQRLGSISFMNHAIQHIYHGLGKYFVLTPGLVDFVWMATAPSDSTSTAVKIENKDYVELKKKEHRETTHSPPPPYTPSSVAAPSSSATAVVEIEPTSGANTLHVASSTEFSASKPVNGTVTVDSDVSRANTPLSTLHSETALNPTTRAKSPATKSYNPNCPPISPSQSPIRRLFFDALLVHWPSHASGSIIPRSQHHTVAWNALFEKHADLRTSLIFGLQGRVTMGQVERYFAG